MRAMALHASRRNGPDALAEVDLCPGGAADFAAPGGRQDGEFECTCAKAVLLAQRGHEAWQLSPIQGCVRLHRCPRARKDHRQMVMPACGVRLLRPALCNGS